MWPVQTVFSLHISEIWSRSMLFTNRIITLFIMLVTNVDWSASRPRWLSWMRRPTGDQEVVDSTPAEVGNILS